MHATSAWMASGRKSNRPKGQLVIVTGGPGSGKSFLIQEIDDSADLPLGFTAADMPLFRKRITLDILRNKVD